MLAMMWKNYSSPPLLVGMQKDAATLGNTLIVP